MKLIVANWKSNPLKAADAIELAKATDREGTVICPPFIFLETVKENISKAKLGAQDDFWGNTGAYTGEISWRQLTEMGVEYVILGHSERRKYLKEGDELINNKVIASLEAGLKVILCVGEDSQTRNQGINSAKIFVEQQLDKDLIGLDAVKLKNNLIVAYEPVWAIGSGMPDTPASASEIAEFIKNFISKKYALQVQVLYGGSVKAENAKEFLEDTNIDGALVGGASLNPAEFNEIIRISASLNI